MLLIQNGSPCFSCLPSLPSLDWEPTFIFLRVSSSVYVYILKRKNLTNHIGMFYALHAPPCPPMSSHSHIWAFPSVLSKTYSVLFTIRFCFLATYYFFSHTTRKIPFNALPVNTISGPSDGFEMDLSFMFSEMLLSQNGMSRILFSSCNGIGQIKHTPFPPFFSCQRLIGCFPSAAHSLALPLIENYCFPDDTH